MTVSITSLIYYLRWILLIILTRAEDYRLLDTLGVAFGLVVGAFFLDIVERDVSIRRI